MRKLVLIAAMLAVAVMVNGCSEEEKKTVEDAVVTPEVQADAAEVAVEEAVKSACAKDCDKSCCKKAEPVKAACPKDCDKPCCKKAEEVETENKVEEAIIEVEAIEAAAADEMVVTVNGQAITEKEISAEVDKTMEMQKKRMPPGMELPDTMKQQIRKRAVDTKVEQTLLSQEMKKHDITVSDEQVLAEIQKIAKQRDQSMEDVEQEIAKMGMTLEDIKGPIRMQLQIGALMESMDPDAVVTEEAVKKFYDENPQHFEQKAQVKASHILCGKRGIKEDEYPVELEKIEKAKARLDAGEAFEDVAKECSTCPSSAKGGDLGFFGKGQMDPAFEEAVFGLEVGQTSGVVKTSFGYHIIKLTDKKDAETTSFDEAKEQITQFLTQQKQRQFWGEYSKTMRDSATIEFSEKEQAARDAMEKAAAAQQAARAAQQAAPRPIQPAPAPQPTE